MDVSQVLRDELKLLTCPFIGPPERTVERPDRVGNGYERPDDVRVTDTLGRPATRRPMQLP
jgi:hypothetical protein